MKRKEKYRNTKTGEIKELDIDVDNNGHTPMYLYLDGGEWKAEPNFKLEVVNSQFFFESAHRNTVKFTKPPLDGSDFPYGVT